MKKSIKLTIVFTLAVMLCVLFAIFASAETYSVQYKNTNWDGNRDKKSTDENGVITLRDTGYTTDTGSYEITGPEGDKISVQRQFYGWYDEQGNFYEKGATVTLTSNLVLREAFGFEVYTFEDLNTYLGNFFWYTRLGADIVANSTIFTQRTGNGNMVTLDLNGHKITSTAQYAFEGQRCGFIITGEGTINHTYTDTTGGLWNSTVHGYGEGQQRLWIGKDVTINTTGALLHSTYNWTATADPLLRIYGKTTSAYLSNTLSTPSNKKFEIYEGAEVTVTGDALIKNRSTATALQTTLHIYGGKFDFSNDINYYSDIARIRYEITGGSFVNKLPNDFLKNGNDCVYNDETGLYDVEYVGCTLEGSDGTHNFVPLDSYEGFVSTCEEMGVYYFRCECGDYYVDGADAIGHSYDILISETPATCIAKAYKTYKCVRCDSTQNVEYGSALGHDYSIISIIECATVSQNGIKRFTCTGCGQSYDEEYSFDPSEQTISVVVKSGEGTKTETIQVKDLYVMDGNILTGIKSFADPDNRDVTYSVTDLVEITITAGFTNLNAEAISGASSLEKITLLDNANITFETSAIKNCSALTTIVVGEATVVFKSGALNSCSAFTTLDLEKANATFEKTAFQNSSIQHLKLGTEKTYSFGENSFKNAQLTEIVFPDGSNITFPGAAAFYACPNLKYVYFGTGTGAQHNTYSNAIVNKPFDCCYAIETLVLMDIDYINEYVFCTDGDANSGKSCRERVPNGLVVYHHGDSLVLNDNAFANRKVYGVKLYTTSSVTSLKNCVYTIYSGIPHAYTTVTEKTEATCTTAGSLANGVITDCPCGVLSNAPYTIYSTKDTTINGNNGSISISEDSVIPATGHKFDAIYSTTDATCTKSGTITYKCANCDEIQTVVDESKPATDHDIEDVEYIVIIQQSCTTQGLKTKNCKNCQAPIENEVIPEDGHDIDGVEWTKIAAPTCTLDGTEAKYCATCGVIAETQAIAKLGHTEGEFVQTLAPDCDDDGLKEQHCTACNVLIATEVIEKLGHDYDLENGAVLVGISYPNGFATNGLSSIDCARCTIVADFEIAPLFIAKGYSTNSTHTALNGGFTLNTEILPLYEQFNGEITYGIIIANANSFGENSFVDADNKVNSTKAMQVPITTKNYSNFDCSLDGFGLNSGTLELIITAYVIDAEGNISFIQAENDYALEATVGEQTFTKVTLDLVVANVVEDTQLDAILPDEQ